MQLPAKSSMFLFFVLIINISSFSQQGIFNYIKRPELNPWYIVTSITQDAQGYMWFGGNGIHRYNGKDVVTYLHDPLNPNSPGSNTVECLYADNDGMIWIGTLGSGLDRFDPVKNVFTHFRHQQNNLLSLVNDTVTAIIKDKEGSLWVGTYEGLDKLDLETGKFFHYSHNANDSTSLSDNAIRVLYIDHEDVLWVGTGVPFYNDVASANKDGGLNRLNKNTGKFTRYLHNDHDIFSLADNRVRAICEDSYGTFWVGTAGDGLHTMNRATGKFTRCTYDPSHPENLSRPPLRKTLSYVDDHITFIKEDAAGFIWIGTMMGGITRYNPNTKKLARYGTGKDTLDGFSDHSGWAACSSRDGTFWFSTWQSNLYRVDPFEQSFPYKKTNAEVKGIYKEQDGQVWLCTLNALIKTDADNKVVKKYTIYTEPAIQNIYSFYKDRSGNFWIGSNEGLISFNSQTEKFTYYPPNKNGLKDNEIATIFEDHNLNLWIGTLYGLYKMDRQKGLFTPFGNTSLITNIFEDRKNNLWISTAEGLNLFNNQTKKFKSYLQGIKTTIAFQDAEGTLWEGSAEGLFRFNASLDSFISFHDPSSGLRYKEIYVISEDEKNNLWLYNSSAVIRLNAKRNNTVAFDKSFGLSNITVGDFVLNGKRGEIFFSDNIGYYDIIPDNVTANFISPQVVFTDFKLGEQSVLPGNNSVLPQGIMNAKEIELKHNQNFFSFNFDVLHFSNPEKNQSLFKLENYDVDWRQPDVNGNANYFAVPPGHYVFKIKGSNANGIWVEKSIEVTIHPPWWETWWFRILSVIAMVFVVYAIVQQQSRTLKKRNLELEEKVMHRTKELKHSLEELRSTQAQLIQQEKMASLGELTAGIAHEIQNPLNFVNNFSEVNKELLEELKDEAGNGNIDEVKAIANDVIDNEKKINHHGKRADAIVKGMLQHSRQTKGVKAPTDINALCDEYLRLSYHGLRAKDKEFNSDIKTDFDGSIGKINIVPQDIGRVLLNLFNNAFYAVNEKKKLSANSYQPIVDVKTRRTNDQVEIVVRDNGNGIPQNIVDKIFQPFFTTKPTGQGTGLGLSLSYDIIKAHGGEIKVEKKEESGSTFTIFLPVKE